MKGLPQGRVMAPILCNIYTNNKPIHQETKQFSYANDNAIVAQGRLFVEVEDELCRSVDKLKYYYEPNHLKLNPAKTKVSATKMTIRS